MKTMTVLQESALVYMFKKEHGLLSKEEPRPQKRVLNDLANKKGMIKAGKVTEKGIAYLIQKRDDVFKRMKQERVPEEPKDNVIYVDFVNKRRAS